MEIIAIAPTTVFKLPDQSRSSSQRPRLTKVSYKPRTPRGQVAQNPPPAHSVKAAPLGMVSVRAMKEVGDLYESDGGEIQQRKTRVSAADSRG